MIKECNNKISTLLIYNAVNNNIKIRKIDHYNLYKYLKCILYHISFVFENEEKLQWYEANLCNDANRNAYCGILSFWILFMMSLCNC